jgi:hypothetical protein
VTARIDHAVSSGTFSLDGETFNVENNVWVVGDDEECVVIDAPPRSRAYPRSGWRPYGPGGAPHPRA